MTVNRRLLFGSLAVALAVVVGVGLVRRSDSASDGGTNDEVTLTSGGDLSPTIGTNAVVTGRHLPNVDIQTLADDTFSTSDLLGRPLIINFWYSTCAPCKRELPAFAAAHGKFGDKVRFVGLDPLPPSDTEESFARDRGVKYELYYDANGELITTVGVSAFPQTLFIDAGGTIVRQTGELTEAKLEELIGTLLLWIALDARLATSFTAGLLAAINPCGFVLLPTYLVYFLGMENLRPGAERASVLRALKVSAAVSAGFMSIFVVIGAVTKLSTNWFVEKAQWVSLLIGVGLVIFGIAMLFGYRLPFTTPKLDVGERDRSVQSMFVFGIAYAVASIGCTIAPFTGVVLGSFSTKGLGTGITAVAFYGVGMALVITGLTVTLAFANTALLRILRRGMAWFEQVAGVLLILTGLYLCWYWYNNITNHFNSGVLTAADGWQQRLSTFVQEHQTAVVTVATVVILAAVVTAFRVQRPRQPS